MAHTRDIIGMHSPFRGYSSGSTQWMALRLSASQYMVQTGLDAMAAGTYGLFPFPDGALLQRLVLTTVVTDPLAPTIQVGTIDNTNRWFNGVASSAYSDTSSPFTEAAGNNIAISFTTAGDLTTLQMDFRALVSYPEDTVYAGGFDARVARFEDPVSHG